MSGASALTVQSADRISSDLYLSACGGRDVDTHMRLLAEIRQKLGATASEDEIARAAAAVVCPVCGCSLVRS